MNRRVLVALLAALLVFPAAAEAQLRPIGEPNRWGPRFRITPFIGFMPAFERTEDWVAQDEAEVIRVRTIQEIGSGIAFGLNLEAAARRADSACLRAARTRRGTALIFDGRRPTLPYQIDGNHVYLGRAGIHHAPDGGPVGAGAAAGERVGVRGRRRRCTSGRATSLGTADFHRERHAYTASTWACRSSLPLGSDRFAVQVGAEDNIIWWDPEPAGEPGERVFRAARRRDADDGDDRRSSHVCPGAGGPQPAPATESNRRVVHGGPASDRPYTVVAVTEIRTIMAAA
jgi:hypothetical protein